MQVKNETIRREEVAVIKQEKETREKQKEKKKEKYNTTKNKKEKHNTHIMYIYIYIFNIEKTVLDIKLKDSPNNPLKDPRFMIFQTPDAGPPLHPFPIPNHQVNKNSFPYHAQEVCRRHDHMDMSPM